MGVWKAFILIVVLTETLPRQYLENRVDFVLVIDRSPPVIANWTPSQEMLDTSFHTELIHTWVQCVFKKLLQDALPIGGFRIIARVVVLMLDRNTITITVEADYYSTARWYWPVAPIPALQRAYVQPYPFDAVDFERTKRNISEVIAARKERASRRGVPEIIIWHVPYDGDDPAQVHHWLQMHRPTADIMVAMPKYWDNSVQSLEANVIVAHPLAKKAYTMKVSISPELQTIRGAHKLFTDTWALFNSCYAQMNYAPCRFNEIGFCVTRKVYIPRGEKHILEYCRNGTKVYCPHGPWECYRLCAYASEGGPCSVTCGNGTKTLRPRNSADELIKYCKPMNRTCNWVPCAQTVATTTQLGKATPQDGASMAPWKVTAIVLSTTIVLAGAVAITVWRVGQGKKKLLLSQLALVRVGNPHKTVAIGTNAK